MSTLSIIFIVAAILFGLQQIHYCITAYAMLASGKYRSVKVGIGAGLVSGACAVLAVLLK